jgi:uncharacterized protein (TIGR01777 family)
MDDGRPIRHGAYDHITRNHSMRAVITGGTGFIGKRLAAKLDRPVVLSRNVSRGSKAVGDRAQVVAWDAEREPAPAAAFADVEAVFHLAGDPVAEGRWTAAKKQRLRESRIAGTRNLVAGLKTLEQRPRVLVSASAVGFYGDRGDEILTEQASRADDFLAHLCADWESEARAAEGLGMRVVCVRIGIVLGRGGGALAKMLLPFRLGLGSPLGNGKQYMPWIHVDDLVSIMLFAAATPTCPSVLNGAAPQPVTNREFTHALGRALHRPTFFPPVPGFMLRLLVGEFGQILLYSQRAVPQGALDAGFVFQYPQLEAALGDVLSA